MTEHPKYTMVKTAMLLHVPFFASLLLDVMQVKVGKFPGMFPEAFDQDGNPLPEVTKQAATMATNGRTIWMDEDFLERMPIECLVFATCHEIGHAMLEHMARAKYYQQIGFEGTEFSPVLWNVAGDFNINDMLDKAKIGKIYRDESGEAQWLLDPKYNCDMSVDDIYRQLLKNGNPQSGKGGNDGSFDKHIYSEQQINPAEMKRAIQSAVDTARAVGKLPGELERFATEFLEPKVSWRDILRTTVVNAASRDTSSWARPHRRRLTSQGVYLARPAAFGCDTIICLVDTSGSIGEKELNVFFTELADIIRTCSPRVIWVVGADSRVASVEELPGDVDITGNPPKVGGGGGTDFRPAFEWVRDQGLDPDVLVYFTDMCGPFPEEEPGYPVVWCSITKDQQAPIGRTIYVDLGQ